MDRHLSPEKARLRRGELLSGFGDMIAYAKENDIRAVLLAGDLSDDGPLAYRTAETVLSLIGDAASIRFFYVNGNHDGGDLFANARSPIPANLHLFGETWETVSLTDTVSVTSRAFTKEEVWNGAPPAFTDGGYHIVMLHGDLRESGCFGGAGDNLPMGQLSGLGIDYLALGHIHSFRHGKLDDRCTWCYPGTPEGRGFDECGDKGFVVLTVSEENTARADFVPFAKRRLHTVTLDITDVPADTAALVTAAETALSGISEGDMVKLILSGEESPETERDLSYLSRVLEARFYFACLRDKRRVKIDPARYKNDISLKGEFFRRVMGSALCEEEKAAVLRCGFLALRGEEDDALAYDTDRREEGEGS